MSGVNRSSAVMSSRSCRTASINKTKLRKVKVIRTNQSVTSKDIEGKKINNYLIARTLGMGQYGKVFLVRNRNTNEMRAMKAIHKNRMRLIGSQ